MLYRINQRLTWEAYDDMSKSMDVDDRIYRECIQKIINDLKPSELKKLFKFRKFEPRSINANMNLTEAEFEMMRGFNSQRVIGYEVEIDI